jgi:hypothetical protein
VDREEVFHDTRNFLGGELPLLELGDEGNRVAGTGIVPATNEINRREPMADEILQALVQDAQQNQVNNARAAVDFNDGANLEADVPALVPGALDLNLVIEPTPSYFLAFVSFNIICILCFGLFPVLLGKIAFSNNL